MRGLLLLFVASTALAAPTLRLPDDARPLRYDLELTVDPRADSMPGRLDLSMYVQHPTDTLWLDADSLAIDVATVRTEHEVFAAHTVAGDRHTVGFHTDRVLPVGPIVLHVEYRAPLSATEVGGASRQHVDADDYVFTQFAAIDARRVLPCFDEPGYKVPWKVALVVRDRDRAFANMPEIGEEARPGGWKRIELAQTLPLSSYLVAFAVGPFDVVDAGRTTSSHTPLRIIVPRGRREEAQGAAQSFREVLEREEAYFGTPYPFGKLDSVAVPRTTYGAMENPGLVMFDERILLVDPRTETSERHRGYVETAVHEFSHQWFGNLVTMKWWNDTWLNEAFATWVTQNLVQAWHPDWDADVRRVEERNHAMDEDADATARPIRHPISSYDDIRTIYDSITYEKGARVIGMFERLVGPDVFRRGVQRYLADHARGNADAFDFMAAISRESGRDIGPAFQSFLVQPGVPVVDASLDCRTKPVVHLSQRRYRPRGGAALVDEQWHIPICARWPDGHACTMLDDKHGDLALGSACPAWVEVNDGGAGYYRVAPDAALLGSLTRAVGLLTVPERLSLVSDVTALANAGELEVGRLMQLAASLADDPDRHVATEALSAVSWLRESGLVTRDRMPLYRRWLDRIFGARARALGFAARIGEPDATRRLRNGFVPRFAIAAGDPTLSAEARALANAWLHDRQAIPEDSLGGVLSTAMRSGDGALWARLAVAAQHSKNANERRAIYWALGSVSDEALAHRALDLLESNAVDAREGLLLLYAVMALPELRPLAWTWMQAHFDALARRLPRDEVAGLAGIGGSLCDEHELDHVRAFFATHARDVDGSAHALEASLEGIRFCVAARAAQTLEVSRFLDSQK